MTCYRKALETIVWKQRNSKENEENEEKGEAGKIHIYELLQ